MKKNLKTIATSLTSLVFLVVGISGVLLYFKIFERPVKELHEVLGLVFVIAALLHLFFNFSAMKQYFKKKIFLVSSAIVILISLFFIIPKLDNNAPNPKLTIINSVLNAPIDHAVQVLGTNMIIFKSQLEAAGISYKNEASLNELAKNNKTSPYRFVDMITTK